MAVWVALSRRVVAGAATSALSAVAGRDSGLPFCWLPSMPELSSAQTSSGSREPSAATQLSMRARRRAE